MQGLQMLQQNALEKLAARDRFKESGLATLKLRFSKTLKCRHKSCDISLTSAGADLCTMISEMLGHTPDKIKMIVNGRVINSDQSLGEQGVKNSSTVMIMMIQDTESLKIVAEQRRMLDQTRADAERLSGRDSHKDDYFLQVMMMKMSKIIIEIILQVADQSGKSLDLPQTEKTSLIIAMSLHEKGRTAMKK